MHMTFFQRLEARRLNIDSLLCVGLDPRNALDNNCEVGESVTAIIEANKRIIDATADLALCYKPNIAFYEALGAPGLQALEVTLQLIPDSIPVILDAKRGDIGATAQAYEKALFGHFNVDAVTLSPYMGGDSVKPFLSDESRGAFLLCRTSNPGGDDIQLLELADGAPVYVKVADLAASYGENVGLVVGGNEPEALQTIRQRHPDIWFLSPGIGAQGGNMLQAVSAGLNANGGGIIPVVARGISQAENPAKAASDFVDDLRRAVDQALTSKASSGTSISTNAPATNLNEDALKQQVLTGLIQAECFKTGSFTLKSGETSPFYIDLRRVMSYPRLMKSVARAYARLVYQLQKEGHRFDCLAGIPVAALPLAQAVSLETGLPMIFPRMNAKSHGTGNTVEGNWKPGQQVLLLDDLITSGASKLEALEILRAAGLSVEHLIVLIERGEAGRRDMVKASVNLRGFANIREFLPICHSLGLIDAKQLKDMEEYARS